MILSDLSIREAIGNGRIEIDPFEPSFVQPSSIDVRIGPLFRVFNYNHLVHVVDPAEDSSELTNLVEVTEGYILHPGEFVLGSTVERVKLPNDLVARLEGKSSLGRLGLIIHSTAGFVDPGWNGQLTLELTNISGLPIKLRPGMKIGQLSFMTMTTAAQRPYGHPDLGSKYQGQEGPVASQMHRNFQEES